MPEKDYKSMGILYAKVDDEYVPLARVDTPFVDLLNQEIEELQRERSSVSELAESISKAGEGALLCTLSLQELRDVFGLNKISNRMIAKHRSRKTPQMRRWKYRWNVRIRDAYSHPSSRRVCIQRIDKEKYYYI